LFTVLFREMGSTGCNRGTLGKNGTGTDEYRTKWRYGKIRDKEIAKGNHAELERGDND